MIVEVHGDFRTATRSTAPPLRRYPRAARRPRRPSRAQARRPRAHCRPFTSSVVARLRRRAGRELPAFTDLSTFAASRRRRFPRGPPSSSSACSSATRTSSASSRRGGRVARAGAARDVADRRRRLRERARSNSSSPSCPSRRTGIAACPPAASPPRSTGRSALVLPSRSEGLPRIAIEALERGRPVIGADAGGIPDVVQDLRNGLLVEPESVPSLAEAHAARGAGRPSWLERLARAGAPERGDISAFARRVRPARRDAGRIAVDTMGSMAVQATTPTLDARAIRADFPIFEQLIHGKPLAFLDSAASSQKPRQMMEAMTDFYSTSYANVHRGVYVLAERATAGARERAREGARPRQRARRAGDHLRPQRDRGDQPRRLLVGDVEPRPRRPRRRHRARAPLELRAVAVHRRPHRARSS